jgi:hypothetical protein
MKSSLNKSNISNYTQYKMSDASVFRQTLKQLLLTLLSLTVFGNVANGVDFLNVDFEGTTNLPVGWTQSTISGGAAWKIQGGGGSAGGSNPSAAHGGTNNATLYLAQTTANQQRLISPAFDTTGSTNISLTFWHTQTTWSPDQDELKVFYSSNNGSTWTQLIHYTASVSSWTERTLTIPITSANTRIAFEGNAKYGYGVCLDDILVSGINDSLSGVSVIATDAEASEVNQDPGTWTITRTGNTTGAISVNFTLSGNATQGSDYTINASSPISFAAGETSKVVTLTPVDDTVAAEGYEVATLTLTAGTGYVIGDAADDITISDDEGFDLNILVIGSTHSFSEGGENDVVPEKPFNPTTIATHLQSILTQDPALTDTVNVVFEDIFKTKTNTVRTSGSGINDITAHCYSLAQHFMWPDGKTTRLANLRGEAGTQWDYIVVCNDPYIMANFPGMYAEGVKLIQKEVAQSSNAITPQVILMAQWPENSSSFTADDFNEVAHRVGSSSGLTVVPAGKAWDSYTSQDTNAAHPTPRGEYLAAASIYSKLYSRSAKTSGYNYVSDGDNIADHGLAVVQANASSAQYSGTYTSINPFQMKYVSKRVVSYRQTGTSTERGLYQALHRLDDVHRIKFNTTAVNGKWDFNYGRGNDGWEDEKDYEVDSLKHDRAYGFPMHHYYTTDAPFTMPYGIDKYYYGSNYEDGTDLGIAYNMIRPNTREDSLPEDVRAIPIRLMWLKMEQAFPGFNPLRDNTHMSYNLDDASAAFMYTLLSGRSPVVEEPATQGSAAWMQWLGHKVGYETAWQMSHLTTRTPSFRVLPSSTAALTVTPTTTESMSVQFMNPPQSDVTVTVSVSNVGAAILGPQTLVFTSANYNTPQVITVAGIPGADASEVFEVQFATTSDDEIYDGLSDSWSYTTTRSSTVTVTQVDNGVTVVNVAQNQPKTINIGVSGANSGNTIFVGPFNGSTIWTGAGVIEYTPNLDFIGVDQIAYAITVDGTQTIGVLEITVVVPDGQVSVAASDSSANEEGSTTGSWTISRLGDTTEAIDVLFTLSGTAVLGSDYTVSHTSPVNIPVGQSSVIITLTAIDDTVFGEGDETAILTITEDAAYALGTASATITIVDNDNNTPVVYAGVDQTVTLDVSSNWTPAEIATFSWYDASDASTIIESGGAVSQWNDKSGNNKHVTQSSEAKKPTTGIRTMGGLNVMNFDATEDFDVPSFDLMGKECWTVIKKDTLDDFHVLGSSSNIQVGVLSSGEMRLWGGGYPTETRSTELISVGSDYVLGFRALNPKQFSINGTNEVTTDVPNGTSLTINHIMDNQYAHDSDGLIGEIIVTAGELTTENRQRMEGYLAWKWGMETNLPTGHPHEDASPGNPGVVVNLNGDVSDPDNDPFTTNWSLFSGPIGATVIFSDASAIDSTATFTQGGTYVLLLTADDGYGPIVDEVTITVNAASARYNTWTGGTFDKPFTDTEPNSDPDGDSMTNQQEFAFGTDPTLKNGVPLLVDGSLHGLPVATSTDGGISFDYYFLRRKDHATSGSMTYTPQFSSDLLSFPASLVEPTVVVESLVDSAYEVVKVQFPEDTQFVRMKIDVTP